MLFLSQSKIKSKDKHNCLVTCCAYRCGGYAPKVCELLSSMDYTAQFFPFLISTLNRGPCAFGLSLLQLWIYSTLSCPLIPPSSELTFNLYISSYPFFISSFILSIFFTLFPSNLFLSFCKRLLDFYTLGTCSLVSRLETGI